MRNGAKLQTTDTLKPVMNATTTSTHTHIGTPPPGYKEEWVTHTVHVHGFANLSSERDVAVDSPEFMRFDHQWRLVICPGGGTDADEGMVCLYLENRSNKAIEIDYGFSVSDGNGKQVAYERSPGPKHFAPVGTVNPEGTRLSGWGFTNFAKRSKLLSSLINGTLVIVYVCVLTSLLHDS
jgi:hypothetical protein